MDDPAWTDVVGAIASIITIVVVVGAAWVGLRQLKEAKRARHGAILADFTKRWDGLAKARAETLDFINSPEGLGPTVIDRYRKSPMAFFELARIPDFFEDLGIHVQERHIPLELVAKYFDTPIKYYWEKWSDPLVLIRKSEPSIYKNFEWLASRIQAPIQGVGSISSS
jgi:hypothetical protein